MAPVIQRLRAVVRAARRAWRLPSQRSTFKGADVNRLTEDWITSILHPDDETRWTIRRLRARSRDLSRNNPFCRAFLNALAVNVLGAKGPKFQSQVRNNDGKLNKLLNDRVERAWSEWSRYPTVDGKTSLARFSHQVLKTVAKDGESFVRMHSGFQDNEWGFALEVIDADQLDELYNYPGTDDQPEIRMGVEVNGFGRPLAYHFWSKPERQFSMEARTRIRIPARDITHLYDPERVNSTRGLPWAATVMWPMKMLDGFSESVAVHARAAAAKMGFWTRKPNEPTIGEITTDPETNTITMDATPGSFDFAPDGYELQSWDANQPNAAYAEFVKAKLREIASGLGMSYNALANDLEGVNYSSLRSGLLIEHDVWRTIQEWWVSCFLDRVHAEWLDAALLSEKLVLDSRDFRKFLDHEFFPRGWPWVDPEKDTKAGIMGIQSGLTSRRRLLAEQGLDLETVFEELKGEMELAEEYGIDVSGPPAAAGFGAPAEAETKEADPVIARANGHLKGRR